MKNTILIAVLLFSVVYSLFHTPLFAQNKAEKEVIVKTDTSKDVITQKDVIKKDFRNADIKKEISIKKMESTKSTHDKVIGKNKDGRVVFEGPRGGRYYLSEKGAKVYLKKLKN